MVMAQEKANDQVADSTGKSEEHIVERLAGDSIERTTSNISYEVQKGERESEVEEGECECCGMSEEWSVEYKKGVREKFWGKFVCGLCGEAVKEEMEKNGGKGEEALKEHMRVCVKFNRIGRWYPVLYQAEAIKEILKKSASSRSGRPRNGIARSSSCTPDFQQSRQAPP